MSMICHKHENRHSLQFSILDGVDVFGMLHTPTSPAPHPLVIFLHGLASHKMGSKRTHVELAEKLTKQGIAVLRVDLPGHGDSEGEVADFSFQDYLTSAKEIITYGYGLEHIDTKKIGLFGSSLGGTLALMNLSHLHHIKCLAIWAPTIQGAIWLQEAMNIPSDILSLSSADNILYSNVPISKAFCSQFLDLDIIKEIPNFPHSLSILHMHGDEDTTVSPRHQEIFSEAMSHTSHPCEIRTYPNMTHSLTSSSPAFQDLTQWLTTQLIA